MQQIRHFVTVMDVGRRDAGAMNQSGLAVRPDVQLHSEVPLVTFLGLVHLRITALILVLGRGRCGNQRGVDNRAARKPHSIDHKQFADLGKECSTQIMGLEQVAEVHQCRGIRYPLSTQIDPAELTEHRNIVQRVLTGNVAQVEPVGDAVHPQHPLQTHRRPSIAHLRVVRFNQRAELGPRHQPFHAGQKLRLARRPVVLLESFCCRQRHLLHRRNPCDQNSLSDNMTKESFTAFDTYSVFP